MHLINSCSVLTLISPSLFTLVFHAGHRSFFEEPEAKLDPPTFTLGVTHRFCWVPASTISTPSTTIGTTQLPASLTRRVPLPDSSFMLHLTSVRPASIRPKSTSRYPICLKLKRSFCVLFRLEAFTTFDTSRCSCCWHYIRAHIEDLLALLDGWTRPSCAVQEALCGAVRV